MRKFFRVYLALISCLLVAAVGGRSVFADVNNFYFSDFTGDYYLSKDEEGISHLKVIENVTAVFPDYEQNKGICRQISFTNMDGKNVTLPSLTRENIKVFRNDSVEPIYSIEKGNNYYNVCTGTEEYVLGEQKYRFEYEFSKVVTEFEEHEELYWDTNGNGATQKFDKVTARLHFEDINDWSGKSWCYVGRYGENGQERCEISNIDDGVMFMTSNVSSFENLTFDVELKKDAFVIPAPVKDYTYIYLVVGLGVICLGIIIWKSKKLGTVREKVDYYDGLFIKPEYQPSAIYSLNEMAEVFIGKKKDVKVAMLLGMIVKKKIELKKMEKRKWAILVKNLNGVRNEEKTLLAILNGGTTLEVGNEIELKRRSATSKLISLKRNMESDVVSDLKNDGLVEGKYAFGSSEKSGAANVVATTFAVFVTIYMLFMFLLGVLSDMLGLDEAYGRIMVFELGFYLVSIVMIFITAMVWSIFDNKIKKFANHTKKGLEASRYMDGLEMYIRMAEADRMKMLQSVKGVDVSAEGIVKLYEKLLPYAAVFGLEKSWMKEMKDYCQVEKIEEPDYLLQGIAINEIARSLQNAASIATTSTVMASSGGGSSSGFSGGGGGGFSGGGGGGGGFSGR